MLHTGRVTIELLGLHHSSFPVADLERSLAFYTGVLGLALLPRPDLGVPGAWLGIGDGQIHLIECAPGADVGTPPSTTNPMGRHTAISVAALEPVIAHLESAGLAVTRFGALSSQCWVRDPDGHVIEFITPAS